MSKQDYLKRALQHIGSFGGVPATEENVAVHGLSADGREYTVVLDMGIKGSPKYRIPLKELPKLMEPAPLLEEVEPEPFFSWNPPSAEPEAEPEPAFSWREQQPAAEPAPELSELDGKSYRDLQVMAKEYGIPANQSAEELILALQEKDGGG